MMLKIIPVVTIAALIISCNNSDKKETTTTVPVEFKPGPVDSLPKEFSIHGTVTAIEPGKDGYTATLKLDDGQQATTLVSRVNMLKTGGEYKTLSVGDTTTVYGDTMRLGTTLHMVAKKIHP